MQGNPYKLDFHEWYPFERAIEALSYRPFHEYEKTFENMSAWFKDGLFSRYYTGICLIGIMKRHCDSPEGVTGDKEQQVKHGDRRNKYCVS